MKQSIYELFQESKNYKSDIDSNIASWLSEYNGEPYGNETDDRSKIVWKIIKKQTKTLSSNIVKQFVSTPRIVKLNPSTKNDVIKAKMDEKLINYFWNYEIDKVRVTKRISLITCKEGTAFVKVGWKKIKKEIYIGSVKEINPNKLNIPNIIVKNGNIYKEVIKENRPTIDIIANEDVFTDPLATEIEDSRFIFIRKEVTIEDLKSNPIIENEKVDNWIEILKEQRDTQETDDLHNRNLEYMSIEEDKIDLPIDSKVTLYEFWYKEDGNIKVKYLSFNGAEAYIFASKDYDFKFFPFVAFNLEIDEFSIWGKGLSDFISDEQKFSTSVIRGIIDNMSSSNYGTKFIKKGALDSTNFNRLMSGSSVVEVNTTSRLSDVMIDGNFNELPSSVYNVYSMIENQAEGLTGISKAMQGLDSDLIKSPASNYSAMMSQSQIRLFDFISSFQQSYKKIFLIWLYYSMKYLSDDEIYDRTGISIPDVKWKEINRLKAKYQINKLPPDVAEQAMQLIMKEIFDIFNKNTIKYDVIFRIGGDGLTQIRINQVNMLMQQLIPAIQGGSINPEIINKLLARIAELMEFPDIADDIENYKPQPNPMQEQMNQVRLQQEQAKAMKDMALAENAKARSKSLLTKDQLNAAKTNTDIVDKASSAKLKQSQASKAKAEAIKITKEITDEQRRTNKEKSKNANEQ